MRSDNKSGVAGVCWHKGDKKWAARIKVNYKLKNLGSFKHLKDAVQVRWEAEVKYGYPNCCSTSSAYQYLKNIEAA
jgi:hypothetical protein